MGEEIIKMHLQMGNKASACIYQYKDDKTAVYFSNIEVSPKSRKKGIGTKLLKTLEYFGELLEATNSYLWVRSNSHIHEWYIRNGYTYYKQHDLPGYIWLTKVLKTIKN